MTTDGADDDALDAVARLPPRPVPPRPEDCCGSGCARCVYDIHEDALEEWERACAAYARVQKTED